MDRNDSALKRYIRSISDALPCSRKMKRQIVSQLRESITDYLEQNPAADFAAVQGHFGTPQQIAASCVNDQDASTLLHKLSIKKKVLVIVAGVMAAILLMWAGYIGWAATYVWDSGKGIVKVSVEKN